MKSGNPVTAIVDNLQKIAAARDALDKKILAKRAGCLILATLPGVRRPDYAIELHRCDTHEKITNWVFHLAQKKWVTNDHIRLFVEHACRAHGLNYTGNC